MPTVRLLAELRSDDLILHAHSKCRSYASNLSSMVSARSTSRCPNRSPRCTSAGAANGIWRRSTALPLHQCFATTARSTQRWATIYPQACGARDVPDVAALVPGRPSRADALAALRVLREAFKIFCLGDAAVSRDERGVEVVDIDKAPGADESAFLAGLLTAVCRASLPLAPGCLVRAAAMSGAGAGKGLLVRCIRQIAFGQEPHAVSGGRARRRSWRSGSPPSSLRPVQYSFSTI